MSTPKQSFMYLSDKLILKYLTNATTKYAIKNFYNQNLIPNFKENIDYKQVDKNHELVLPYFVNTTKRVSHNKKYYLVSQTAYQELLNRRRYVKKIGSPERNVCERLSKELKGEREVCLENGKRVDILTETEIIEVKNYKGMLGAVGQILYYGRYYPKKTKVIHLFGHDGKRDEEYESMCEDLGIKVRYE